jgi:hypothetical protein
LEDKAGTTAIGGRSHVRVSKLKDGGYTWQITAVAEDTSAGALAEAKEQAVKLVRELERELGSATKGPVDLPF